MDKFGDIERIEKLDSQIIYELVENIFINKNGDIKIKFKYQDEFIQVIVFIKKNKCDIMVANYV